MTYEEASRRKAAELRGRAGVRILALETSCDETAAAVIENGRRIVSNVVFSQIDLHELYGGVVPEIASRAHMEACDRVIDEALKGAGMKLEEIDALAVTKGPGLVGALLTGVNCMKGLAYAAGKPLIGVNHIEGHVSATELDIKLSGASDATLEGQVAELEIDLTGASNIIEKVVENRYALFCDRCEGTLSGASDAYIHCDGSIKVSLTGGSELHYTGNASTSGCNCSGGSIIVHDVL